MFVCIYLWADGREETGIVEMGGMATRKAKGVKWLEDDLRSTVSTLYNNVIHCGKQSKREGSYQPHTKFPAEGTTHGVPRLPPEHLHGEADGGCPTTGQPDTSQPDQG